ncbi:putative phosphohydrolase [Desulfosporosinus orientis DSM 765]|uniref:Putative phosphohydrolase n=1 Tax=Desulfosporosinus orientis (strain ATCC 19365 / DSM 765 / NCIMB 8382 / VKM B-1628 / Singapore I) TaxID=768706 RepID=G7WC58_DESOD|nr:metallophosphoesterase [Desulfosporosinus orientis]AET70676.1 putative phosphohydrolase [Desulfosporosinus orientis DSM 765]
MPKKTTPPLRKPMSRRSFFRGIGGFIANHWLLSSMPLAGAGVFGWAEYDTLNLKCQLWDLFYPNLPLALEDTTICQLSDLHLESLRITPEHIKKSVMAEKPDLIVLTGDIISTRTDLDKLNSYLAGLTAPQGNFIVMGNNDYSHLSHTLFKRYVQQLKDLGWTLLINKAEFLPNLNLWIIGVDDPATAHDDVDLAYEKVLAAQSLPENPSFRLVLSHSTDCLDGVAKNGADLFLAGHTHGGQIRLPGLKPLITNTYLGDLGFYEGYHVINGVPLYINTGIGESMIPIRFNVPPEIAFFTLHQGNAEPRHHTK